MIYTCPFPFLPPFLRTDLQPSHNFLTELLTFIPRTCSCTPTRSGPATAAAASPDPSFNVGLFKAEAARDRVWFLIAVALNILCDGCNEGRIAAASVRAERMKLAVDILNTGW